ncbi:MAG: hypothetical protein IKR17_12330, partial [Bacteroidales bacterium]|nr:hypothetical protein [Bacteroidales bacterium]
MNDITIYAADETALMTAPITEAAVHEENLMQDDKVSLKWNAGNITDACANLLGAPSENYDKNEPIFASSTAIRGSVTWSGVPSLFIGGNGTRSVVVAFPPLTNGQRYTFSFYYIRNYGSRNLYYTIGSSRIDAMSGSASTTPKRLSMTFIANAQTTSAVISSTAPTDSDYAFLKFQLEFGSSATEWNDGNVFADNILPAGSFITLNSIRYYLAEDYRPDSKDLGLYTYNPEFIHEVYLLKKMPFLLINATNSGNSVESDWNYTGSLDDLASTLEDSINAALGYTTGGYTIDIDESIENAVNLSFSNMSILDALNAIAEAINGEWYTDEAINGYTGNKIIHFAPSCLHEGGQSSTLAFTAGNQVGFPSSQQKHEFYNRYYIFGSTRNIPQDYNGAQANTVVNKRLTLSPTLHPNGYIDLPQFTEEGEIVTTEDTTKPSYYDEDGNVAHYVPDDSVGGRVFTKVIQIDDVYPRANLHVSAIYENTRYVEQDGNKVEIGTDSTTGKPIYSTYTVYYLALQNEENVAFTINDSTYDADENPDGSKIKGLNVSIHFKDGALTGREFEVTYHSTAQQKTNIDGTTVNIPANVFEVVKIEDNTIIVPNTNIAPVVDDEVIIFNIRMPQAYIDSAYKELDKEAMKAIYEEWRDGNEYEVQSNPEAFTQNVYNLHLGRHVKLTAWGRLIDTRITKLQTHLDRDFEQTISFTKGIKKGTISTLLTTIEATSARMTQVELKDDSNLHQLRQQLYSAQRESIDAMFDSDGYFTEPISPVTIQTQVLQSGAKSTQLNLANVLIQPNTDGSAKNVNKINVVSSSGKLVHYGLNVDGTWREWNVANSGAATLANNNLYYIYARCVKATSGTACTIVFDQTQHVYDETGDYYYFLIGT